MLNTDVFSNPDNMVGSLTEDSFNTKSKNVFANPDNMVGSLTEDFLNTELFCPANNNSTYYDRKIDTQGIVPGCSLEEAEKQFCKEYHIK